MRRSVKHVLCKCSSINRLTLHSYCWCGGHLWSLDHSLEWTIFEKNIFDKYNSTWSLKKKWIGNSSKWLLCWFYELHEVVMCCFEQNLEATFYKTATVQPLISHLTNHSSKMNIGILLWALKLWQTSVGWPAKTHINQFCVDIGSHLEDLLRAMTRESQKNLCYQHNLMIIISHSMFILKWCIFETNSDISQRNKAGLA